MPTDAVGGPTFTHPEDPTLTVAAADVTRAAARIAGWVQRTPILSSRLLDQLAGRPLLLKAEHLQYTGSYKARGAANHLSSYVEVAQRPRGVIAASSGNHGQAVAWAAREAGVPATIVVPRSISPAKREAVEDYGAQLVVVGDDSDERLAVAQQLAQQGNLRNIPPYDHPLTIAGQGTWLVEALEGITVTPEAVVVPVSGGGLAAGTLLAASAPPAIPVYGVEPQGAADLHASLAAGRRVPVPNPTTVADALRARQPGALTFEIIKALLTSSVLVSDEQIIRAMRLLAERAKQVVEPGGAAALAAALSGDIPGTGTLLVLLTGGNVSMSVYAELLASTTRGEPGAAITAD